MHRSFAFHFNTKSETKEMEPWRRCCNFFQLFQSIVKDGSGIAWSYYVKFGCQYGWNPQSNHRTVHNCKSISKSATEATELPAPVPRRHKCWAVPHATLCAPMLMSAEQVSELSRRFPMVFIIHHLYIPADRTSCINCTAQCKMKTRSPWLKT